MLMKTKNYKFLAILLGLLFWSSVSYAQDTIAITASSVVACPGNAVTIDVDATNFDSIGSISLVLNYDTLVLDYNNTVIDPALNAAGILFTNAVKGQVKISGISFAPDGFGILGDRTIFEINFDFISGASALGWNTSKPGDCQLVHVDLVEIPCIYTDGSVSAPPLAIINPPVSKTINENDDTYFTVNAIGATLTNGRLMMVPDL